MINNGRLQFAHKSTIFSNRHVACAFIEKYVEEYGVLIGEPVIVRYNKGEENGTAAILAVGEGDKYQLIDIELINEDIERINENHAATDSFVYRLYSQFISEMERNISKDKEIDTTIDFLRNQITTNNLVSINTDLNSTSSYIRVTENGTEAVIDVKLDDNGCEFLKHSGNGLSDLGIKEYVNGECEVVKDMVRSLNDNNKNEHLLFKRDIEKINDKIGTGFTEETVTKSVSDIKNKLNIFFDENAISDNTINTLKEIQEYITLHGSDAAEMVNNITANTSAIAKEVDDRKAAVSAETAAREAAVSGLNKSISDMDAAYKAADAALEAKITAETAARESAISAEANVRREKDDELDSKIVKLSQKDAANHQEALNKISSLNDLLIVLSGVVENNESDIEAKLNTETQERIDLDKREINHHNFLLNKLSNVDNEIQTLKTEDNNIKSRIQTVEESYAKNIDLNNEILRAKNSEENLNQKLSSLENTINDEIKENISSTLKLAQKGVDDAAIAQGEVDALETLVSDETKARENADAALSKKIDTNASAITKEIADREAAVSAETKARQDADAALDAKISAETTAREAADTNLAQTNSIQHEEIKGSISALTNEVNAYATKIDIIDEREASHHTDLSNEINSLSTQLATLSAVTQTADNVQSTITNNINTLDSIVSGESSDLEVTLIQQNGKLSSISITQKGDFTNETISKHTSNGDIHVTELDKDNWNRAKNDIDIFLNDNAISDQTVNTLKEIQEYINNHGEEAAVMVNNITTISAATENNKTTITTTNERITVLETNLTNEINNREKGDDDVKNWVAGQNYLPRSEYEKYDDTEVSANVQGLIAKDEELLAKIEANASAITQEVADRKAAVSDETAARETAVSGLNKTISDMDAAYKAKDEELRKQINEMDGAYQAADTEIKDIIGTGFTGGTGNTVTDKFNSLSASTMANAEAISAETAAREEADVDLQDQIDALSGTVSQYTEQLANCVIKQSGHTINEENLSGITFVAKTESDPTHAEFTVHKTNDEEGVDRYGISIMVNDEERIKPHVTISANKTALFVTEDGVFVGEGRDIEDSNFNGKKVVTESSLTEHTSNDVIHVTTTDKDNWNTAATTAQEAKAAVSAETKAREDADDALDAKISALTDDINAKEEIINTLNNKVLALEGELADIKGTLKTVIKSVTTNDSDLWAETDDDGNVTFGFNREEDNSQVAE